MLVRDCKSGLTALKIRAKKCLYLNMQIKNEVYKLIFFSSAFFFSCKYAPKKADDYKHVKGAEQCFTAIFQKDSAFLRLKTMPNHEIRGSLVIKYSNLEPNELKKHSYHVEITGKFTKDTLFADYSFADRAEKTMYQNPIALLREGNKLVMGFGAIETYLGRSWLMDHKAINFAKCRFQFAPAACNN
jgi:hypothetical protein